MKQRATSRVLFIALAAALLPGLSHAKDESAQKEAAGEQSKGPPEDVKALTDEVKNLQAQVQALRDQLSELRGRTASERMSIRREESLSAVSESHPTGHVWGEIASAGNDSLFIRGPEQNVFPVWVNEDTEVEKKKHSIPIDDVHPGDKVDVSVESREGDLIARRVEVIPDKEADEREKAEEHRRMERERAPAEQKTPSFDKTQD